MTKLKILSVDDDVINRKLLNSMLKKNPNVGSIIECGNGLEALNYLEENGNINLILLDIKMPIMNGIEFLNNMQSREKLRQIPVIVLTTDETKKYEAMDYGAYDFLVKPIREVDLAQKIKEIAELM